MENIRFGRVKSAKVNVDNSADGDRLYDVSSHVTISDGQVTEMVEGRVYRRNADGELPSLMVAEFMNYSYGQKTITYHVNLTAEEEAEIADAINGFISAVKSGVHTVNVECGMLNVE